MNNINNINNPIHYPFEDINPIRRIKQTKRNQEDILINKFNHKYTASSLEIVILPSPFHYPAY